MSETRQAVASGLSVFAGALMITVGLFSFFDGLAAIIKDQFFVKVGDYAYKIDVTTWGWIHLVLGILITVTGCFVLMGSEWARLIGITLAVISAIANFLSLPYYPLWAIVLIALDVAVIWGLATWRPARV